MSDTTAGDEREALAEILWNDLADHWDGRIVGDSWSDADSDRKSAHYDVFDRLLAAGWRRDGGEREYLRVELRNLLASIKDLDGGVSRYEVSQSLLRILHRLRAHLRVLEPDVPPEPARYGQSCLEGGPCSCEQVPAAGHERGDQT